MFVIEKLPFLSVLVILSNGLEVNAESDKSLCIPTITPAIGFNVAASMSVPDIFNVSIDSPVENENEYPDKTLFSLLSTMASPKNIV